MGLGWVAGAHMDAFNQVNGAHVRAVCTRREHDLDQLEKQYGIPLRVYKNYEEMLNEKYDGTIIDDKKQTITNMLYNGISLYNRVHTYLGNYQGSDE